MDAEQRDPVLHGAPSEAEGFKESHWVSDSGQVSEGLKTVGRRDVDTELHIMNSEGSSDRKQPF